MNIQEGDSSASEENSEYSGQSLDTEEEEKLIEKQNQE